MEIIGADVVRVAAVQPAYRPPYETAAPVLTAGTYLNNKEPPCQNGCQ
jgi:hypothetical protein